MPPHPSPRTRTKGEMGPMAFWWDVVRSLTCWLGRQASRV